MVVRGRVQTVNGSIFLQQILNGLTLGCVYALIALGYTLIFGVMRLIFFAQGEICMLGAFGAMAALAWLTPPAILALPTALCGALLVSVLAGVLAERFAMRPLRGAPRTKQLIASLGVSMILQNAVLLWVSSENIVFPSVIPFRQWSVGALKITSVSAAILLGAPLLMLGLKLVLHHTRVGLHLRAVAESPETAQLDGIRIDRTMMLTFVVGSVLAAFAGIMLGSYYGIAKYDMGFVPGIKGLSECLAAGYVSSTYKDLLAFIVLVLVLVVRPEGLLGRKDYK